MIVGIGLDIADIDRIENAYDRRTSFAERVLTDEERDLFLSLKGKRKIEFLAGRYAAKEAYSKAVGTGIGKLKFRDIEILNDSFGKPIITKCPFEGNVFLSITHTDTIAAAQVVLEK